MPEPWELTREQARREAEELRAELDRADREAAPLFAEQLADLEDQRRDAEEEEPELDESEHGSLFDSREGDCPDDEE